MSIKEFYLARDFVSIKDISLVEVFYK